MLCCIQECNNCHRSGISEAATSTRFFCHFLFTAVAMETFHVAVLAESEPGRRPLSNGMSLKVKRIKKMKGALVLSSSFICYTGDDGSETRFELMSLTSLY